ncbi:DUF6340 family protein [Dysgonomonas termitidis]|uniref:DUF6340 family protein n=1 Tax=Dysgonomonas termitidis TaxID=1516126 RepID=A0ABV9KZ79_9BACT
MKQILSSIILIYILSSCTTINLIPIDVRQPAFISFPPEITNVVIVDNSPTPDNDEETATPNNGPSILSMDSARTIFLNSLTKFMNEEKYFNKVELYPYKTYNGSSNDITLLPARKVQTICQEKDADALISLNLFAISAQLETENTAYFSNYSILGTKLGIIMRAYAKDGSQYGNPVGLVDSLFREETADWSRIKNNVDEINSLVTEMSVVGADKITGNFIPSWKTSQRWYYSDNSSEMKKAAKFVEQGKWAEAADIWGGLYDDSKPTKKIRLASNIALANESLDDIENAVKWITTAFEMLPEKSRSELAIQIALYKAELDTRLKNIPKLKEQLGIEEEPLEGNPDSVSE